MPRRRDERARVIGPFWREDRRYWVVTTVVPGADGGRIERVDRYFRDEEEAKAWRESQERGLKRLEDRTIGMALDIYSEHLLDSNTPPSRDDRMRRLRLFFREVEDTQIARLQPDRAAELYATFKVGHSVDYHRNTLGNAKGFIVWCKAQRWISSNPFAEVKGVGRRKQGKEQLTGDEARKFYGWCTWKAWRRGSGHERRDSDAAIGALMLLLMGLRSSDVTRRVVRDVDLEGTILHVTRGKTAKSNRARRIPEVLQPLLRLVTTGRRGDEPLFPADGGGHHTKAWLHAAVRRFCRDAEVPVVCPHGLKGTSGSVLADTGQLADRIADHLSHESTATTQRHYVRPGALEDAAVERGLRVIVGGTK